MTLKLKIAYVCILIFTGLSYGAYASFITPSITHDELIYASNAFSFSRTGRDVTASHFPFDFVPIHSMYAELPASLMAPFFNMIDNPVVATHALPTIFSLLLPFIFASIIFSLCKDHRLAFFTALVVALSPLNWQFSKLTYDAYFSLFFYFLAAAVYFYFQDKKSWLSIPIFLIGFFNYQGYKLILLPWTVALLLLKQVSSSRKLSPPKTPMVVPIFALLLTTFYLFVLLPRQQTISRLSQTILTDQAKITQVQYQKSLLSMAPQYGRYVNHQLIVSLELGFDRLLGSLNPHMLFLFGEPASSGFAVWTHGFFYLIDLFLIVFGLYQLMTAKNHAKIGKIWLLAAFAGLIPAVLSTISQWYLMRSLFTYYLLLVPIAYAFFSLFTKYRKLFYLASFMYLISVANFAYQYYFRYPLYRSNQAEMHERVVVEYAQRLSTQPGRVIVYDDEPHYLYLSHLLLNKVANFTPIKSYQEPTYTLGNTIYTNQCQEEGIGDAVLVSDLYDPCPSRTTDFNAGIVSLIDSGIKYRIVQDHLCHEVAKNNYIRIAKLTDLTFDNLTNQEFCQRWITANQTN